MTYQTVSGLRRRCRATLRISVIGGALLLVFLLMACSKYESPGPDFSVEMKLSRRVGFSRSYLGGMKHQSTYTIENLKINGRPIELVKKVTTAKKSFFVDTKDYGPMKIEVQESPNGLDFKLSLFMTREQKEKIRALGKM
jgi:hypothetical protein